MSEAENSPRGSEEYGNSDRRDVFSGIEGVDASENAFQKAIALWRTIDLTTLQKQLDNEASEIITNQRDDLVERKEVAQKTKEYRKLSDADKLVEYKSLLKAYQQFIDHISNHRKSTESLFLNVYNHLSEAPDPYPLLEATIDSLVSSEDVTRLNSEVSSLRTTNARLSTQAHVLEGRIEEVKRDAARKEEEYRLAADKSAEGFQAVLDEKIANWEAKERGWQEKLEHQEKIMKEMKASYEVNMRMGRVSEGKDDDDENRNTGASLAELELVSSDLERTNMRLAEMESRNEQLRMQLAQASSSSASSAAAAAQKEQDDLDAQIVRLESANSGLLKKIDALRKDNEDGLRDVEKKYRALERENEMVRKEGSVMKEKVKSWSDYEDIKRELEVLKTIEFSTGDDDEDEDEAEDDEGIDNRSGKKESLEQLLLARNKKLGNELTVLRVSHQDLSTRLTELQEKLAQSSQDLNSSRALSAQLENDLQQVQTHAAHHPAGAPSVAGTYTSRYQPSQAGNFAPRGSATRQSPTSSIFSGKVGHNQGSYDQLRAAGDSISPGGQGILPMITAQRDRYKQRITQLEDELQRGHDTITSLRQEVASLQKDNLQLYEKTRYISSYRQPPNPVVSSTTTNRSQTNQSISSTSGGLSLDRYRAAYESNISPFEAFRTRESARAFNRMSVLERMIHSITRVIMRSRLTRNLFVGYCVFLHILVFGVVYWNAVGEMERGLTGKGSNQVPAPDVARAENWEASSLRGTSQVE